MKNVLVLPLVHANYELEIRLWIRHMTCPLFSPSFSPLMTIEAVIKLLRLIHQSQTPLPATVLSSIEDECKAVM